MIMKKLISALLTIVLFSCSDDHSNMNTNEKFIELPNYNARIIKLNKLAHNATLLKNYDEVSRTFVSLDTHSNDNLIVINDIINNSKDIMNDFGLTENLLFLENETESEKEIAYLTIGLGLASKHLDNGDYDFDLPYNYETNGDVWNCLGQAIGLDAFGAFIEASYAMYASEVSAGWAVDSAAAQAFRAAGVKAARKAITRFLGPVGAMIAIGVFINCMIN